MKSNKNLQDDLSSLFYRGDRLLPTLSEFFKLHQSTVLEDFCIKNHIVIASDFHQRFQYLKTGKSLGYTINPNLSSLNFQQILDPYTTYQEIELFVNNLPSNSNHSNNQSNSNKIISQGFCPRTSFRHPFK